MDPQPPLPPLLRRDLPRFIRCSTCLGMMAAAGANALATDFYKANNPSNLNTSAAWEDAAGVPFAEPTKPTNTSATSDSDLWVWDSRVLADNSVSLGNDLRVRTIRLLNPGGPVTINGGGNRTITIPNGGGIDLSTATQDLTINNLNTASNVGLRLAASNAAIAINVAAGRTFTLNSKIAVASGAGGATVNFTGTGTTICNREVQPSNIIVAAGEVQLNSTTGSTRLGTHATTVNGGRLSVGNTSGSATGTGAVAVNTGGTLTGNGIITGSVTLNSGATLIPGYNGIGTIKAGSLTLAAGTTIKWEAIDPVQADIIEVTASNGLTINGGTIQLYNSGTTTPFTGTGSYKLFAYSGAIGGGGLGSLAVDESSKIAGQTYLFGISGGFITLTIGNDSRPQSFWNADMDGNWSTPANWTNLIVPNAQGFIANLGGNQGTPITAPRTITLNAPTTVGTLKLDSVEPFTLAGSGNLTFDEGASAATLHVEKGSHVISTPIAIPASGLLTTFTEPAAALTLQGVITGDGGISKSGGSLILTADNPCTGTTSNGSGVLQIGNGGATGSVAGPIANSGTLRFNHSGTRNLLLPVSGTGNVEFAGTGTTSLTAANPFSGPATVSAGILEIAHSQALENSTLTLSGPGGAVTVADSVTAITLGGLAGDRPLPLTNAGGIPLTLSVGKNNTATSYTGSTTGTGGGFIKEGTGTLSLAGTHVFTGTTTISGGVLSLDAGADFSTTAVNTSVAGSRLLVNGGTLRSSGPSLVTNASAGFDIAAGTANFDGGITSDANNAAGAFFVRVTGGSLNAASLSISRGSLNLGTEPATGQTTNGLYINGGAVTISGALNIGAVSGANSSVSTRMDSGSLTVLGPLTAGINNPDRWSVLDIAGGTFTSTDASTGVRIGSAFNGRTILHVRGSGTVAKAGRIQFGQADFSGSTILNLAAGNLYIGSGGMVLGSANPALTARLRLAGGVLGATADSTSDVPVSLTGPAVVTGADESDAPHAVTFSGSVDGTGSLTKNGSGTVSFTSPGNSFSGAVLVDEGTLGLAGRTGPVTVSATASLAPVGTLNAQAASNIDGTLAIRYDAALGIFPGRLHSEGVLTLGAAAKLNVSGTGPLTAPYYIIASGAAGVTGTFTLNGPLPAGYTLTYNLNNGSGFPVVALVGSPTPYDTWAVSFGLSGPTADPTADPDADSLPNLVEFGMGRNPTLPDGPGPLLGRTGDFLTLTFDHIAGGNITFAIQAATSLDGPWTVVQTYPAFPTAGTTTYTDNIVPGPATTRRFLRLSVTEN